MAEVEQGMCPPMIEEEKWRHLRGLVVVGLSEDPAFGVCLTLGKTVDSNAGVTFWVRTELAVGSDSIRPELRFGTGLWTGGNAGKED